MENVSIGKARYFLTFIDDYSRKIFVYFLESKSQVLAKFIDFKAWVETQTERKIKVFRTDNGAEYCSKEFDNFFRVNGITHQLSNVYTPQQNGVAERINRTLVERAKCMIFDADLDKSYWAEAVNMAAYIINRSVSSVLIDKTPEEVWCGGKIDLSDLKIFGSSVMVHNPRQRRKKWDRKSLNLIFVGYDTNKKSYRCIDTNTKKLTISRDVVFIEKNVDSKIIVNDIDDEFDEVRDNVVIFKNDDADIFNGDIAENLIDNSPVNVDENADLFENGLIGNDNDGCLLEHNES